MNHNSSDLFTFASSIPRARARLSTNYPHQTLFNSPTNGWFVLPSCDPRLAHLYAPKTQTEPQRSLIMTTKVVDLELRLDLPGQTRAREQVSGAKMVSRSNQTTQVIPKNLMLTLGHKSYAKNYKKRVRHSKTKVKLAQTKGKLAQTKDTPGPTRSVKRSKPKPKPKRDYYGPCERCGRIFLTSPTYASHMNAHYRKDETEEERKERLSKKRKRVAE